MQYSFVYMAGGVVMGAGLLVVFLLASAQAVVYTPVVAAQEELAPEVQPTSASVPVTEELMESLLPVDIETATNIEPIVSTVRAVPFYSQFADISYPSWRKVGCGVASLAMLLEYYTEVPVLVDDLLLAGIDSGAYLDSAGWTHAGLIALAKPFGLAGGSYGLAHQSAAEAFAHLQGVVREGPVMVSVYYTFTPGHPIPHLVVISDIDEQFVYYNDPAEPTGGGKIAIAQFMPAWKQRYIEIRPIDTSQTNS